MTRPDAVVSWVSSTPQVCAAAVTNIARAAAPTCRMGSQLVGVAVLPPALWAAYLAGLKSACSTLTLFQSTSSSSAISIGSMVLMPCPTSGFFATIVTVPSGAILMYVCGSGGGGGG